MQVDGDEADGTRHVEAEVVDLAVELAVEAGRLAVAGFNAGPRRWRKADGTDVTDFDLEVEDALRRTLARRASQDAIYGEERGASAGSSNRRWILDPIDGTTGFARGVPLFRNLIACEDEYGPAVAVVHQPMSRRLLVAGRGRGCWLRTSCDPLREQGRLVHVSGKRTLVGAGVQGHNIGGWPVGLLESLHAGVLLLGEFGGGIGVATGTIDALVIAGPAMGYEDLAPLPLIIGEAGGRVTDLGGAPVLTGDGSVLASNGLIHDALIELTKDHGRCRGDLRRLLEAAEEAEEAEPTAMRAQ